MELVTNVVGVHALLTRWLWNFTGIVASETGAGLSCVLLLSHQHQGKIFVDADVCSSFVIIRED